MSLGKGGDGGEGQTKEKWCRTWQRKQKQVRSKGRGSQKPGKRGTNSSFKIIEKNLCAVNCAALWDWLYWLVWRNEIPCRNNLRAKYGVLWVVQHQSNDCACVYIRPPLWTEHCFMWQSVGQHSKIALSSSQWDSTPKLFYPWVGGTAPQYCFIQQSVRQHSKTVLSSSRWDSTPKLFYPAVGGTALQNCFIQQKLFYPAVGGTAL